MPMIRLSSLLLVALASVTSVGAQPVPDVDLGERSQAETVEVPIHLQYPEDVFWVSFLVGPATASSGFLDIYTRFEVLTPNVMLWARAGLYDAQTGLLVTTIAGGSHGMLFGSFGQTSPVRPWNVQCATPNAPEFCDWFACGFSGREGELPAGAYLLAIANDNVGFYDGFDVRVTVLPGQRAQRDLTLYLRVQPPEVPFCDPDLNWDGNADQDDVALLVDKISRGEWSPCDASPDYNRDGTADMDDVRTLIDVIASGECPG
ncbi:MAG: hypothetical protein DYG92_08375 [Leptolyngbya sp. PLA1]|nr:hypothetical protein [Leptolyngbya sp. PLA1]